jgi:hypothetical protein
VFNSNIIALDLGLKAKEERNNNILIMPLGTEELKQISTNLTNKYGDLPGLSENTIDIIES